MSTGPQSSLTILFEAPFGIGDYIGTVHLHEGGFDEKTGLAAATAADDQDVFVPGVLGIFRAAGHGELFRLG